MKCPECHLEREVSDNVNIVFCPVDLDEMESKKEKEIYPPELLIKIEVVNDE